VTPRRRYGWRLRILLGLNALLVVLFIIARLDPLQVEKLGPWCQTVYDLLNPPEEPGLTASGRGLVEEVGTLGGRADRIEYTRGFLGFFRTESFHIDLSGTEIGDDDLAGLAQRYGDRFRSLDLRNTTVTNDALRHLRGLRNLERLGLGIDEMGFFTSSSGLSGGIPDHFRYKINRYPSGSSTIPPISPITDAGLVHLQNLSRLITLSLSGLPITDTGLASLGGLPNLEALYLSRTKVQGPGLSRLRSLPKLVTLYLDGSEMTDQGSSHLSGASSLQHLSLNGVPLTAQRLIPLKALPRLRQLDVIGCGLRDEEVKELRAMKLPLVGW
jgi:hypothetical protein